MHGESAFFLFSPPLACCIWTGQSGGCHTAGIYICFLPREKDFLGELSLFEPHFLLLCEITFRLAAREQTDRAQDRFPPGLDS